MPSRPTVFVGESSPTTQLELKEKLDHAGIEAYLARSAVAPVSPSDFIGGFKCALMTLERLGSHDDAMSELELLRMYQPGLAVAFLHGNASVHQLARASAVGPIFRKEDELDAAIAWVVERARA